MKPRWRHHFRQEKPGTNDGKWRGDILQGQKKLKARSRSSKSKRFYKDGELDGVLETYYDNGQLKSRGIYKEGNKIGAGERFHPNGRLRAKNHYRDGKLDGIHEIYHSNGDLRHRGRFKGGIPVTWPWLL